MTVRKDEKRGTWFFVIDLPPVNGKRQQLRRRGFPTKKAALAAQSEVVADGNRGTFVRPAKVTLLSFLVDEWLPAKRPSLRASAAHSYERMIDLYIRPRLGSTELTLIDGAMLNALYGQLLSEGRTSDRNGNGSPGLAPKTVRNVHGMLSKAFRDGVRWGRLTRNPCEAADPPKNRPPEMMAWSSDEIRTFMATAYEHRWGAIWALMVTTGMRRGEVLGLRWSDIDLDAETLAIRSTRVRYGTTVDASTPKTAAGVRTIALGPVVAARLRTWRKDQLADRMLMGAGWQNGDADLVVTLADGTAPNPESFSNLFKKLAARAHVPVIRLHDVRHSYATSALAAGVPVKVVSQRLGHADVGVTLKVYAHVMPGDDQAAALAAESLLS